MLPALPGVLLAVFASVLDDEPADLLVDARLDLPAWADRPACHAGRPMSKSSA